MATPKLLFLLLLLLLFLSSSIFSLPISPTSTNIVLARAAIRATLSEAKQVHEYIASLTKGSISGGAAAAGQAVADCKDCFDEAVGELRDSVEELTRLEEETFAWQMSNVETWVSAALTNQVTCLDGLEGCKGRGVGDVRKKVVNATRVTSDALDLINKLATSGGNY